MSDDYLGLPLNYQRDLHDATPMRQVRGVDPAAEITSFDLRDQSTRADRLPLCFGSNTMMAAPVSTTRTIPAIANASGTVRKKRAPANIAQRATK
jgi:hypothetical protein